MRRLLGAGLVLATLVLSPLSVRTQAPAAPDGKSPQAPDAAAKRPSLDKLKLPPGAVFILAEELKNTLKLVPHGFFLKPEKFQEMTDRMAQLEAQLERLLKPDRAAECRLRATVEGDAVQLQADFVFTTKQPWTAVLLGCRGAQLTDAKLKTGDGDALPLMDAGPAGYTVLVEKAGQHHLTMSLKLPVTSGVGAAARRFEMSLPGAAVTTLTVELGQPVREIRWNKTVEKARAPEGKQKRFEDIPLGAITNLELSWHEPLGLPDAGPLLTARGQITVKLEEKKTVTTAELALADLRGKTKVWRLWLPPQARVVKVTPPEGIKSQESPPGASPYVLSLSEATADVIKVEVKVEHARPLARLPVGPFAVADAFRQEGTIEVRAAPAARRGVRLQYVLGGDADEPGLPRDHAPDVVAFFRYWNMAVPAKPAPPGKPPAPGTALLEIELTAPKGHVETFVDHTLRVRPVDAGLQVTVTTKIRVKPLGDPVDSLDVQLPRPDPGLISFLGGPNPTALPDAAPWAALALFAAAPHESEWQAEGVEMLFPETSPRGNQRKARIRLPSPKESTLTLTGTYTLPPTVQRVRLPLPRPLAVKEGRATVHLEVDGSRELLVGDLGPETPAPGRHKHTYETETAPAAVEMAWRPYRPELPVAALSDIEMHERVADVTQQFTFQFPERSGPLPPGGDVVRLSVPAGVRELRLKDPKGPWKLHDPRQGVAWAQPRPGAAGEPLVLLYEFALPAARGQGRDVFEVPLIWPEQATRMRSKVRLWSDPETVAGLAGADVGEGAWRDRGTEVVARRGLPTRVLTADKARSPLLLRLERSPALLAGVVVDRALIQVKVDEDGLEHYTARFRLRKVTAAGLDVRLPAPAALFALEVRVNGHKDRYDTRDGGKKGTVVHVPVAPSMVGGPVDLQIDYQLPRNQPEAEGIWQTILHAPEILGNVFLGRVRWQVTLPDSWVPVAAGADVHPEQTWDWHGWLPAPVPSIDAAALEKWVTDRPGREEAPPSLVCSRTSLEPLRLLRMPRQAWFLLCSGVLLVVGLGLYFAPLSHYSFWLTLALLGLGVVAAGVLWPAVLPAVLYGCEPGALVLAVLLGFQWLLHQRYRRQVVFLPGFKRLKPGSSLVRGTRGREPSTVDAPAVPPGSSGQGSSQGSGS
jgi:hypothetical protein